ncbi:MAG: hypothetical protein FWD78_03355 [Treponema sp.]|nr:hypothetical protein [Treponema sp.]
MKHESFREFAKQYAELAHSPAQEQKRRLWRDLNSLKFSRPAIYVRKIPYWEFFDYSAVKSEDRLLRGIERMFAESVIYRQKLIDDYIFEPWISVRAVLNIDEKDRWGVPCALGEKTAQFGAAAFDPPIKNEEDLARIKPAKFEIDEKATAERIEKVKDALGPDMDGVLDVVCSRVGVFCEQWHRDISTDIAKLRGLEQIMWDVYDRPEWFHRFVTIMRDTVLEDIDKTEKAGSFRAFNSDNQAMAYGGGLPDPVPQNKVRGPSDLWVFMASQEFTGIGPELYDEFMLQYQKPIMERFGLSAYGCCEDMNTKIPLLKKIKNMRRIAITPFSDVRKCAELIGPDYVASYRPKPTDMIAGGLDEDLVSKIIRRDYQILKEFNCPFDITLKDVETIAAKPQNMIRWVEIVRKIGEEVFGAA